jgi:hypothetical protein
VDDSLPVRLVQRVGDLDPIPQELLTRHRSLVELRGERLALQVLHDEVIRVAFPPDVYSAQMWGCESCEIVLASRSNLCRSSSLVVRCSGRTLTATVLSRRVSRAFVSLAHSSRADRGKDLVRTKPGACSERHVVLLPEDFFLERMSPSVSGSA